MLMTPLKSKSPRRVEVSDLVLEFQTAIIDAERRGDRLDYAEALTAAATRMEAGVQDYVERRVAYRLRFTEPANDNDAFPGIISSAEFVRGFRPPDYLVDGIVQSGFLYSITGQTGAGKTAVALALSACVATGNPFAGQETKQGHVLYFAGENPDDVTMRWIGLCYKLGRNAEDMEVSFIPGVFSIAAFRKKIEEKAIEVGGLSAIIIDTTAAYFDGDDENSNVEMGRFARMLRDMTKIEGRPTIIAASHPVKNAAADNLLPRGGGAFLNEVDGNLSLAKKGDASSELYWQGKFRGPEFKPITFDLVTIHVPTLVDTQDREIPTVMAVPVDEAEMSDRATGASRDDRMMLLAIRANGNRSLRDLGEDLGWGEGAEAKRRAQTSTDRLKKALMIKYELGSWVLTNRGETSATSAAASVHREGTMEKYMPTKLKGARRNRTDEPSSGTGI